jgi:hypothetical protein
MKRDTDMSPSDQRAQQRHERARTTRIHLYRVTVDTEGREVYEIGAIDGPHAQKYVEDDEAGEPKTSEVISSSVEHVETIGEDLSDIEARKLGPFVTRSATSRKAALDNYPRQGSQRDRIVRALRTSVSTREELSLRLNLSENTIRPRVKELLDGGWIEPMTRDGEPVTHKTTRGSDAVVLKASAKALVQLSGVRPR